MIDFTNAPQLVSTQSLAAGAVLLNWQGGNTDADVTLRGKFNSSLEGFTIERGKDTLLDDACQASNFTPIQIRHQGKDGGNVVKDHWWLGDEAVSFYPLTTGPASPKVGHAAGRWARREVAEANVAGGVGTRWPDIDPFNGKPGRSQAAVKVLITSLVDVGYLEALQWTCSSFNADCLLIALIDHCHRVAPAAAEAVKVPMIFPALLALPIGGGPAYAAGKGDKTTMVTPPMCLHPKNMTADYVQSIALPAEHWALAERLYREAVIWAKQYAGPRDPQVMAIDGPDNHDGELKRLPAGASIDYTVKQFETALHNADNADHIHELQQAILDHRNARRLSAAEAMALGEMADQRLESLESLDIMDIPF